MNMFIIKVICEFKKVIGYSDVRGEGYSFNVKVKGFSNVI